MISQIRCIAIYILEEKKEAKTIDHNILLKQIFL